MHNYGESTRHVYLRIKVKILRIAILLMGHYYKPRDHTETAQQYKNDRREKNPLTLVITWPSSTGKLLTYSTKLPIERNILF